MIFHKCKLRDCISFIVDNRGRTPPVQCRGRQLLEINALSITYKYPKYSQVKKYVSEEVFAKSFRKGHPTIGDILIPTVGTLGAVSYVNKTGFCIAQNIIALRTDDKICDSNYLYYYLCNPETQKRILNLDIGAVQPSIKVPHLMDLEMTLPSINIQKQIACILSVFDDKIDLNNTINNLLQQQAHALFKAWFVDYIPFGGITPTDWREFNLADIADFQGGYSYKSDELQESTIAMATIKNFDRKGGFKTDGFKEIVPSYKLKESQTAELFDVLVAHTDLTQNAEVIGNAEILNSTMGYEKVVFSMDLVKVVPKYSNISQFLLAAILQDKRFKVHCLGYVNGTTVLHLGKKALPEYKLYLPNDLSILSPLSELLEACYQEIAYRIKENDKLATLRDTLLPKLMSGEIDVSNVKI